MNELMISDSCVRARARAHACIRIIYKIKIEINKNNIQEYQGKCYLLYVGLKTLGTIGRLNGLSFPPNLNCPDSFRPPKPPPRKIK